MIGDLLDVVVTTVAEFLPWRVLICVGVSVAVIVAACVLVADPTLRLSISILSAVLGLGAGVAWEARS